MQLWLSFLCCLDTARRISRNLWWSLWNRRRLPVMKACRTRILKELESHGINLSATFSARAWYWDAEYLFDEDEIRIPYYLIDPKYRYDKASLSDYIRHEYGHAFQREYEDAGYSMARFHKIFGPSTDKFDYQRFIRMDDMAWDRKRFATRYAQYDADEDFAETFALYLKRHGSLKSMKRRPVLLEKLRVVDEMVKRFAAGNK